MMSPLGWFAPSANILIKNGSTKKAVFAIFLLTWSPKVKVLKIIILLKSVSCPGNVVKNTNWLNAIYV